ncbi:hypothetical protein Bca4012_060118 [Brassica carinata]
MICKWICKSDRVPDPKPRWNPKPEQIRILESIFNSGTVNPPREEIQRIRIRLQEYGQIGDANVFYWFQNRKSRAKHKLRVLKKNPKMLGCNPNKTRRDKITILVVILLILVLVWLTMKPVYFRVKTMNW